MFRINEQLSREENIKLAEKSAAIAKELYNNIMAAVEAGFKHVPNYSGTKYQQLKAKSAGEVLSRLYNEMGAGNRVKASYDQRDRMAAEEAKRKAAEKAKRQREEAQNQLLNEAVQYLISHGKQIVVDFKVENAIEAANTLAFNLEVAKLEAETEPIEFSGSDNCEDCSGWIPGNHRCKCGNHRVYWVTGFGHSFKSPSVYAEAY